MGTMTETNRYVQLYRHVGENQLDTVINQDCWFGGEAKFAVAGGVSIELESNYPWDGNITYKVKPETCGNEFTLAVRIPGWCKKYEVCINGEAIDVAPLMKDGYAYIKRAWNCGDVLALVLDMPVVKMYSNTAVRADAGCVALMRGPLVYAFESADNAFELQAVRIPRESVGRVLPFEAETLNGIVPIEIDAIRMVTSDELYSSEPPKEEKVVLRGVPYYTWGNRSGEAVLVESKGIEIEGDMSMAYNTDDVDDKGVGQMRVWILEK